MITAEVTAYPCLVSPDTRLSANNPAAIKALCKAQAAMPKAIKDSDNPFFSTKYESLAAVQDASLPHLHANGFAVLAPTGCDENGAYLETILMHESGHSFSCRIPLIVDKNNMQGFKSAVTYARRIGLGCLSGVAPEDDDGNKAAANPPKHRAVDNRPDNTHKTATAPDGGETFAATPEDISREIQKMRTITSEDEFRAYWGVLCKAQPSVAKHPDVIAAKNDRKEVIGGKEAA